MDSQISQFTQAPSALSRPSKYSLATRIFHWFGAVLILCAFLAVEFRDTLENMFGEGFSAMWLHKSFGLSFLIWTLLRIANRTISKAPAPIAMPKWQTALSHLTHFGLYLTMLAMPMAGLLMSQYGGRAVSVFGLFEIPVVVAPDRAVSRFFGELHEGVIFPALAFLIFAHIGAALYHQFIMKDNLMARMR